MSKFILIVAISASLLASIAHAQEEAQARSPSLGMQQVTVQDNPRSALAERLVNLSLNGMEKVLQKAIDKAFENLDENLPEEQVRWLRRNTAPVVQSHMRPLIAATAAVYAEQFTEAELNAMIAFYETPMGQNIARKQLEVSVEIEPAMQKFQEGFMTEVMTKFCGQFDCEGEAAKETRTAKPSRR